MAYLGSGARQTFWAVVVICFSSLVTLLFFAGSGNVHSEQYDLTAVSVEVSALTWQQSFSKTQRVVGRVEANRRANVGFELSGLVAEVYADDGDLVNRGDILATLDTQILESQFDQVKASVDRAEAQEALARSSLLRIRGLVDAKVGSQQDLDEAEGSLKAAIAGVNEAKANLQMVKVNLEKSKLLAPFDAQILSRYVDDGNVVSQGQAMLEVVGIETQDVRMPMPANLISELNVNQTYDLKNDNTRFRAKLKSIGKQRSLSTRTIDAIFSIDNEELGNEMVLPGDLLTLDMAVEVQESGAWVPLSALSHGIRGLWNVYTVDQQANAKVVARAVEVIYSDGRFAFIRGAISPEMLVVVSGTHRLAPGQHVAVERVPGPKLGEKY